MIKFLATPSYGRRTSLKKYEDQVFGEKTVDKSGGFPSREGVGRVVCLLNGRILIWISWLEKKAGLFDLLSASKLLI